jgi:hypothetical protein
MAKQQTYAEAQGKVGYLDRDGIGYRKTRATAVLAAHSHTIAVKQDKALNAVLARLRAVNFDIARLKSREVEYVFAYFNAKITGQITAEFSFNAGYGAIRDLKSQGGHCDLCGKGDSRDDGGNEDKLRYQFLLHNTAGGQDIWVGSSCIWQHGLHVDGAANMEEAKEVLRKALQDHIRTWKVQDWQLANPDHETIPECWELFRRPPSFRSYPVEFYEAIGIANYGTDLSKAYYNLYKPLRTASKFYARKLHLTEDKTATWHAARDLAAKISEAFALFREAMNACPPVSDWRLAPDKRWADAIAHLEAGTKKREQQAARVAAIAAELAKANKRKRKPSGV